MSVKDAYNEWAEQYDTNENKTRDAEAGALRETLSGFSFECCLEIGCGTGKNTERLLKMCGSVVSVDLSDEMLARAKEKISSERVRFVQADINNDWDFASDKKFDLVTFSLVLEHIENLEKVFENLKDVTADNGYVYVGELHPFKQYLGSKARYETENGLQVVNCFNHNISDFTRAASNNGFQIIEVSEYFDNDDRKTVPRVLVLLFKKTQLK